MWLHIRGVGEWTNRLYTYFEREQERLHKGEIPQFALGISKQQETTINIESGNKQQQTTTPQKDYLSKNISRIISNNRSTMIKSSSFDTPRNHYSENYELPSNSNTQKHEQQILKNKIDNPFNFEMITKCDAPIRPPRQLPGTSKLAMEYITTPVTRSKMDRQISENQNTAIKKIQASLQRTFSRKGKKNSSTTSSLQDGYSNDAYITDEISIDANNKVSN